MALQLTGAFKRDALPNLQARLPAVVIGGGLTGDRHRDRADGVLPGAGREDARRSTRRSSRELGEAARARAATTPRSSSCSTSISRTAARFASRAGTRGGGRRAAGFRAAGARLGRRDARLPQADGRFARLPPEPRRGDQGARGRHRLHREPRTRSRRCPTSTARVQAVIFKREGQAGRQGRSGRSLTLPARTVLVAAGTSPNITYEKEAPGTFQLDAKKKFFQPHQRRARRRRRSSTSRPIPTASSPRTTPAAGSSPTTATTIRATPATSSRRWRRRRTAFRTSSQLFARRAGVARSGAARPARDAAWQRLIARLDDELLARVVEVSCG